MVSMFIWSTCGWNIYVSQYMFCHVHGICLSILQGWVSIAVLHAISKSTRAYQIPITSVTGVLICLHCFSIHGAILYVMNRCFDITSCLLLAECMESSLMLSVLISLVRKCNICFLWFRWIALSAFIWLRIDSWAAGTYLVWLIRVELDVMYYIFLCTCLFIWCPMHFHTLYIWLIYRPTGQNYLSYEIYANAAFSKLIFNVITG
jgi:hypothetical protein